MNRDDVLVRSRILNQHLKIRSLGFDGEDSCSWIAVRVEDRRHTNVGACVNDDRWCGGSGQFVFSIDHHLTKHDKVRRLHPDENRSTNTRHPSSDLRVVLQKLMFNQSQDGLGAS